MLLHTNTIFICNKIRDYLPIFRCSTSSEPGQCCLYKVGVTAKLSRRLLFHVCQEWGFSNSNASCRWQEVYGFYPPFMMKSTSNGFGSILDCPGKQWMCTYFYNKYFMLIRLAKEISSLHCPVELSDYKTVQYMVGPLVISVFLHSFDKYLFSACFVPSM